MSVKDACRYEHHVHFPPVTCSPRASLHCHFAPTMTNPAPVGTSNTTPGTGTSDGRRVSGGLPVARKAGRPADQPGGGDNRRPAGSHALLPLKVSVMWPAGRLPKRCYVIPMVLLSFMSLTGLG